MTLTGTPPLTCKPGRGPGVLANARRSLFTASSPVAPSRRRSTTARSTNSSSPTRQVGQSVPARIFAMTHLCLYEYATCTLHVMPASRLCSRLWLIPSRLPHGSSIFSLWQQGCVSIFPSHALCMVYILFVCIFVSSIFTVVQ